MDVAFVNRMLGMTRGGGEIWDLKMAEQLEKSDIDVTFYVGEPLFSDLSNPVTEFDSVTVPTPHLRDLAYAAPIGVGGLLYDIDSLLFCRRVANELLDADHDIIHTNSNPQFGRYVDQFDVPVVIKMNGPPHSLWHDYINPFSSSYDFFENFNAVIATGVTTEEIEKRTGINVHTINPGVNTEHFTPDYENTDSKTVLFVGRFVPAKNITALLRAFKKVRANHPDAELVLIGDGPQRSKIEPEIDTLNLGDAVTLTGYIDNEELPEYYRQADVFALSSRQDNHPITLLEAMSCGTPVVAPKIGWIPHIINQRENGLLYDTQEELVTLLDRLLSNPDLQRQYGEHGRQMAISAFDWEQQAKKLETVYSDISVQDI